MQDHHQKLLEQLARLEEAVRDFQLINLQTRKQGWQILKELEDKISELEAQKALGRLQG